MHILFLTENFPPEVNATASRVYERACYWVKWGHEVTVLTGAPNFPEGKVFDGYENRSYQTEERDGIRVVRVKTFISPNSGFARRTLDFVSFMGSAYLAGLFQRRPDVVVATSPQFFCAVGGWALAETRRVPFVFEIGDLWPASISAVGAMRDGKALRALERLELFLYARAAAIVALTPAFKADITARGVAADKVGVVINGVDLGRFQPRRRDEPLARELGLEGKFVVGYIGTMGMAHGLINAIEAAERLRGSDVRLLFVGTGADRDMLKAEAEKRRLDNVVFVPRQPKDRIAAYWSLCDLSLVHLKDDPVFQTVIPSKMFEAMGMAKPVLLVAPEGEASKILRREEAGVVVPPANPDALAAEIRALAADPDRVEHLAQSALDAAPRFTREKQATDMIRVLEAVEQGRGQDAAARAPGPQPS